MRRRAAPAAAVVLLLGAAGGAWWWTRGGDPAAPQPAPNDDLSLIVPAEIDALDPGIARRVREALAALTADRDDPAAWRRLALVYDANDLAELAAGCYERVVRLRPSDARSLHDLAVVRGRLGRIEAACAAEERVVELVPGYAPAWSRLGLWRLELGDVGGARRAFESALQHGPDDVVATLGLARADLREDRVESAVARLEPVAAAGSPNAPYARQLLSRAYRRQGRLEAAEAAALAARGAGLVRDDPWRQEVEELRAGLTADLRRATELLRRGRRDEALALVERVRESRPDDVALLTAAAGMYRAAGRVEHGLPLLEEAVRRRPGYYPAHLELARSLLARSRREDAGAAADRAAALRHAGQAAALNPALAAAHRLRGELLLAEDPAAAAAAFREAARCDPRDPRHLVRAGVAYTRLRQWESAAAALEQARALAPADPHVREALRRLEAERRAP